MLTCRQRKYAVPPTVPAVAETRAAQPYDARANRPALKTGEDAAKAFAAHYGDKPEDDWEWRQKR